MDLEHLHQITRYDSIIKLIREMNNNTDLEAICKTFLKFWPLVTDLPIYTCIILNQEDDSYIGIIDGQITADQTDSTQKELIAKYNSPKKIAAGQDQALEEWLFPKLNGGTAELYVSRLESINVRILYGFAGPEYPFPKLDKKFAQLAFSPIEQAVLIHFQEHLLKLSEELERAKERAEEEAAKAIKADQVKTNFLANMSHELRTPLNAVLGLSRLLMENSDASEESKGSLQTISQNALHLLGIVSDILDFTQIEAQEVTLDKMAFNLADVIENSFSAHKHLADAKKLTFDLTAPGDFPKAIGDPTRISSIFSNIIGNAIKYTPQGGVTVGVSFTEKDSNNIDFTLEVTDTGVGIEPQNISTIFDKFNQADNSTTREFGGTGLGLALTKQLVDLMNGTITVESEVGKGSTFKVILPFELVQQPKQAVEEKPIFTAESVRVLIAEDHPMNQMVIKKALERLSIKNPTLVENGALAVEAYQKNTYDLILMDCQMPEMSGYDASKKIREIEEGTDTHIKIVAVTANTMIEDREKCFNCGMDDFIGKPYKVADLKETLSRWVTFPPAE